MWKISTVDTLFLKILIMRGIFAADTRFWSGVDLHPLASAITFLPFKVLEDGLLDQYVPK